MNLTTDTKALRAALALARSAVNTKSAMPILACVRLSTAEGLTLEASDLALRVRTKVDARVSEPGSLAIDAKWLASALETCGPEVTLSVHGTKLRLASGRRKAESVYASGDDFPKAPAEPSKWDKLPDDGPAVIERALAFTSEDDARPNLCGVCLDGEHALATNGNFAGVLTLASEVTGLLPSRFAAMLPRLQLPVYLAHEGGTWYAQAGETVLSHRDVEGLFPAVSSIIPKPGQHGLSGDRDALLAEARAAEQLTFERGGGVELLLGDGLSLRAQDYNGHEYTSHVACETHGKQKIKLGASHLVRALNAMPAGAVTLSWESDLDPALLCAGADLAVIMGMRAA